MAKENSEMNHIKKNRELVYGIAITADVLDYLVVGLIPVAGDVIDAAAIAALAYLTDSAAYAAGVIELIPIPMLDLIPTFTLTTIALDKGWVK